MTITLTPPLSIFYKDSWLSDKEVEPIGETLGASGMDLESLGKSSKT